MSQTASPQCPAPTLTFDAQSYRHHAHRFQEGFITISILGSLYGVLTTLSATSLYALLRRRNGRIPRPSIVLSLTVLVLFTSTTVYMMICIIYYQYDFLDLFFRSRDLLWSSPVPVYFEGGPEFIGKNMPTLQVCIGTTTLAVNVVLGDAIVWWRACVIWRENRIVKAICGVLLLSTLVFGVVDSAKSYQSFKSDKASYGFSDDPGANVSGSLFDGLPIATGACVLSLCTNLVATLLVAYKAWQSGRLLKRYLIAKVGGSQMEKLFALLVESGALYSAIWAAVVAYQIASNDAPLPGFEGSLSPTESRFLDVFGVIMNGALVPAIAIYPTVIIVLVALNRSHMERGLTQHLESLPTPRLAPTIDSVATSSHESRSHGRSDVLRMAIGEQLGEYGCEEGSKHDYDMSRRTSEERKVEGLVYDPLALDANTDRSQ